MTPDEYLKWLDNKIQHCKDERDKSANGGEDQLLWANRADIYRICKEKFLTLTPPPTTLS